MNISDTFLAPNSDQHYNSRGYVGYPLITTMEMIRTSNEHGPEYP